VEDMKWALELNNATVKRKNFESRKRKQEIRDLKEKVSDLEKGLSSMVTTLIVLVRPSWLTLRDAMKDVQLVCLPRPRRTYNLFVCCGHAQGHFPVEGAV